MKHNRINEIETIQRILEQEITKYGDEWIETKEERAFEMLTSLCKVAHNYNQEKKYLLDKEVK